MKSANEVHEDLNDTVWIEYFKMSLTKVYDIPTNSHDKMIIQGL